MSLKEKKMLKQDSTEKDWAYKSGVVLYGKEDAGNSEPIWCD